MDHGTPLQEFCARTGATYPLARYSKENDESKNCFSVVSRTPWALI